MSVAHCVMSASHYQLVSQGGEGDSNKKGFMRIKNAFWFRLLTGYSFIKRICETVGKGSSQA